MHTNGENWSGYGIWISESECRSYSNFGLGYNDSSCTVAEMRAILVGSKVASKKEDWWGSGQYLPLDIRTDSDACIQLLCSQRTTKNQQRKYSELGSNKLLFLSLIILSERNRR